LLAADLAIADSGLMVLLWKFFTGKRVPRISGLEHVKRLLEHESVRQPGAAMWIVPTETARGRTIRFLRSIRIPASGDDAYVAPKYARPVEDPALLRIVEQRRPSHIVIAVGGGVQDKLGLYLMEKLDYRPAIHCIGAALGFLTGDQVKIPDWADRFYFGWLLRVIAQPGALGLRYAGGVRLLYLVARYRDRLPPLRPRA
jgi:N-acetylglucosaminyldiphosphoundecaprenol N-acetyl-beta-D-mannosaminyltransferase